MNATVGAGSVAGLAWDDLSVAYVVPPMFPPIDGDYTVDGRVDGRDFLTWQRAVGSPAGTLPNDPWFGTVFTPIGFLQLNTWKAQYGAGSLSAVSVPEPNCLWLAMLVATVTVQFGRKTAG